MRDKSHPTPPPRQEARDRKKRARRPPPPTASPTVALPGPRPERLGYQGPWRDEAEPPGSLRGLAAEWRPVGSRQARPGPPGSAASEPWDRANSRRPLGLGVPIQRVGVTLAPAPHPGMNNDPTPGLAAASVTVRTPARALSSGARRAPGSGSRPAVPAGEEQVLGARGGGARGRARPWLWAERRPNPHPGGNRACLPPHTEAALGGLAPTEA